MLEELDLEKVALDTDKRGHLLLSVSGSDEEFVVNLLAQEYGRVPEMYDILPESIYRGQLVDVGKVGYGLYVDVGLQEPRIDALIPLHQLREQLVMTGKSLRKIAETHVLVDNLPLEIRVTSVNLDDEQIGAELAPSFLERFENWLKDDHERLLVFGANQQMIESTLQKSGHEGDIYLIEQLGRFEFSLQCKRGTRATGILAAIGPKMRGVPMHLFIPEEIEEKRNAKT